MGYAVTSFVDVRRMYEGMAAGITRRIRLAGLSIHRRGVQRPQPGLCRFRRQNAIHGNRSGSNFLR